MPVAETTAGLFGLMQFTKDDIMYAIELGVMLLLGLVVLFMVIRPLVKRILAPEHAAAPAGGLPALANAAAPAVGATQVGITPPGQIMVAGSNTAQMIDVAQVQGQVHAQSVHRVGELAEANPTETASIIRQWLAEPA